MDPVLVGAFSGFLSAHGSKFLDEMLKPAATAIGEDALTTYRAWRTKNVVAVATAATEMLSNAGVKPLPVPGRILMPLLEHASFEEDSSLRGKWSALLANSASKDSQILPAFIEILRQLTPVQAKMLDWINQTVGINDITSDEICMGFGLESDEYTLLASDLHRLQLIDGRRVIHAPEKKQFLGGSAKPHRITGQSSSSLYYTISLTVLGSAFIAACTQPRAGQ